MDMSGKWHLSRELSDDPEEMMLLQGLNYFLRKAGRLGSMTIIFEHDVEASPQVLNLTVLPPGGFAKESRTRLFDGEKKEDYHFIFGTNYVTWDTRTTADELEDYFKEEEWLEENLVLEDIFEGKGTYTVYGIWGYVESNGKKQLVKRAILKHKDGREARARQVFELVV